MLVADISVRFLLFYVYVFFDLFCLTIIVLCFVVTPSRSICCIFCCSFFVQGQRVLVS